jgi:hypothetical protein
MPTEREGPGPWTNYHETHRCAVLDEIDLGRAAGANVREILRANAAEVQGLLRQARGAARPIPVRPVGATWSLSPLNMGEGGWVMKTTELSNSAQITAARIRPGRPFAPGSLFLLQAGISIDRISQVVEGANRSLRTNGASNGQTIAGAIATGTHGSVLDSGGIQDQIRAVQIVTPSSNFWVEPRAGVLTDDYIAAFGAVPLRDDDAFAAALVHLGALGFVNAVVLETVPIYHVEVVQTKRRLGRADIQRLAAGDYQGFSNAIAPRGAPYFIQVILNPYRPLAENGLIRMLFKRPFTPGLAPPPRERATAGHDVMNVVGNVLGALPAANPALLQLLMDNQYPELPGAGPRVIGTWGQNVAAHVKMADLFSASIAVPRERTLDALDAVVPAYTAGRGETAMTLRFVEKSAGLLAFTQFEHNCVIDFDGARTAPSLQAFRNVVAALDTARIPFRRHWGKINELDAARVAADYAPNLPRWQTARNRILPDPGDRNLFRNAEHVRLGL